MKKSIYHIVNYDYRGVKHNIMQYHNRLVKLGKEDAARYLLLLLRTGELRITGQESSYHYGNLHRNIYNSGGIVLTILKQLRVTGKQSNSRKSYFFNLNAEV